MNPSFYFLHLGVLGTLFLAAIKALRFRSHRCLKQLCPLAACACPPGLPLVPLRPDVPLAAATQSFHSSFMAGLPRVAGARECECDEAEEAWGGVPWPPLPRLLLRESTGGGGRHCAPDASAIAARAKRERAQRRSPR